MLRALLIYLSKAEWARNAVTNIDLAWKTASRFVAGEKLSQAIQVVERLNDKGINTTLDHLGEHTATPEDAKKAAQEIIDILEKIDEAGVRSSVSIKLTQIGLALDVEICANNLKRILDTARVSNNFVRIDMEDSPWVQVTLDLIREMHNNQSSNNSGVVVQSYLYRSEGDVRELIVDGVRIRLCKGAYKEPPEIAYPNKKEVDINFDHLAQIMIDGAIEAGTPRISKDGKFPPIPAIASHDEQRLLNAKKYVEKVSLPKNAVEFQMLYGIRRDLQVQTVAEGYPVRVYVPYGTEWYPYFVRRLAERPANLWFFISNFFRQ